uniref:B30.2/SPRY domain-containing protein n=1 Tax=Cyclopterus lumpus TaxID=8103 RepID=A0A8C3A333_CYCLU
FLPSPYVSFSICSIMYRKLMNHITKETLISKSPVTLDPNTGSSRLTISEHMTRLTTSDKNNPLPQNPERMGNCSVLGSEGFISGKHSWAVEVGGYWKIGVAARTKHPSSEKVWAIYLCICANSLFEHNPKKSTFISKSSFPQKVNVQLDYDQGILSFFDLDRKTPIHTIKCTFTKMVFPYFNENAKILPAEFSVKIRQPR